MKATLPRVRTLLLALATFAAAGSALAATPFHFALTKSLPANKATVHELGQVKLWFSEAPEDGTVAIHVLDAKGEPVPTTDVAQDPEDATAFSVSPSGTIAPGTYSVSWRGMGDDGHVVRGELSFSVAGH